MARTFSLNTIFSKRENRMLELKRGSKAVLKMKKQMFDKQMFAGHAEKMRHWVAPDL